MKPPMIPPPQAKGPPPIDKERLAKLHKAAVPVGPHTGFVTDFDNGRVLVIAKHPLAIEETVIALPLSLLIGMAGNVIAAVCAPMMAQAERAPSLPAEKRD